MKIEIKTTYDNFDCDTCGYNYAEGGDVYIDGKLVYQLVPHASCFGGDHCDSEQLLHAALETLGITVFVDGEQKLPNPIH